MFKKIIKSLNWKNFIGLTLAGIINSIGVVMFLLPVNLYDSGFSGMSMLLANVTPSYLNLSIFLLILNLPFYLFGAKKQGPSFTIYSLYTIAIYSLSAFLISDVFGWVQTGASPIAGSDLLLCALFGGIVSGVGSGLTIRFGGAIDGVEVMAVLFAKKINITVGTFVMMFNIVLYVIAGIAFSSWTIPLYSIIAYSLGLKAVDFVVEGLDKAKGAFIVTGNGEVVAKAISENFGLGITVLDAKGFYSQKDQQLLYCVVNRFQIGKLSSVIKAADANAFISIAEISDTSNAGVKLDKVIKRRFK